MTKMKIKKFARIKYPKDSSGYFTQIKILSLFLLSSVFLISGVLIYCLSYNILSRHTDDKIKTDIRQTLSHIAMAINSDLELKYAYTESLSRDNAIIRSINYKMIKGLRSYLDKNTTNAKQIILTDSEGALQYDGTGTFDKNSDIALFPSSRILYFTGESLSLDFYFPLFNDNNVLCGSISSLYSFEDYKDIIVKNIKNTHFTFFIISEGKPIKTYSVGEKPITSEEYPFSNTKFLFFKHLTTDSKSFLSDTTYKAEDFKSAYSIALGIPLSTYNGIRLRIPTEAFYLTISILFFLTVFISIAVFSVNIFKNSRLSLEGQITGLKTQRDEFIKHVDRVNALATNKENSELKEYISNLGEEISLQHSQDVLNNKVLSTLLRYKQKEATAKLIKMEVIVKTSLEKVKPSNTELCTLIGNLIDNAIEASCKPACSERYIEVEISKYNENYVIRITNRGAAIRERNLDRIFDRDYTTKEDGTNHGMGLYIVSQLVKKYKGHIKVMNTPGEVTFTVYLPE